MSGEPQTTDTMSDPNVHRDLGRHDAEIETLQREMKQLRETLHELNEQLGAINTTIVDFRGRYRGGLWVIGGIASAGGVIGAAATWVWNIVQQVPR